MRRRCHCEFSLTDAPRNRAAKTQSFSIVLFRLLAVFVLAFSLAPSAFSQIFPVTVYYPLTNILGSAATNVQQVQITPICPSYENSNAVIVPFVVTLNRANNPSMITNPTVQSVLLAGWAYSVRISGFGFNTFYITNNFPTNLVGSVVNGSGWQAVNIGTVPFIPAYLSPVISNLTYTIVATGLTNAFATNTVGITNISGTAWISTNYDALGTAFNLFTNALATGTNAFDPLGSGTNAFLGATNFTLLISGQVTNDVTQASNTVQTFTVAVSNLLVTTSNLMAIGKQPSNPNLTNWATVGTNSYATTNWTTLNFDPLGTGSGSFTGSTNFTLLIASQITNDVTQASNTVQTFTLAVSNLLINTSNLLAIGKQPANPNLTNWATVGTNSYATTNWATLNFDLLGAGSAAFIGATNFTLLISGQITNDVTQASNTVQTFTLAVSNLLVTTSNLLAIGKQSANPNLTNLATVGTNTWATTNWTVLNFDPLGTGSGSFTGSTNFTLLIAGQITNDVTQASNTVQTFTLAVSNLLVTTSNLLAIGKQPSNGNLTNWATVGTNSYATTNWTTLNFDGLGAGSAAFTGATNFTLLISSQVTNDVTQASNTVQNFTLAVSNLLVNATNVLALGKQPANPNLTNLATVGTNTWATTNWATLTFDPLGAGSAAFIGATNFTLLIAGQVTNDVTQASNTVQTFTLAVSNLLISTSNLLAIGKQPSNRNLTNLATVGTNTWATTNWTTLNFDGLLAAQARAAAITNFTTNLVTVTSNGLVNLLISSNGIYLPRTNGQASQLAVVDNFLIGSKTNYSFNTNCIGVIGNAGGTYIGGPFSLIWTNVFIPSLQIVYNAGVYTLQTNGLALYVFPVTLGNGAPVPPAPSPGPYATFAAHVGMNGNQYDGWFYSTNLTWQIQNALVAAIGIAPGYGLTETIAGGTNFFNVNTNVILSSNQVVSLIDASFSTNGGITATVASNIVSQYGGTLYLPISYQATIITNAYYTNLISAEPVIANGTIFIETNGSGSTGGGASNGIQQLNGFGTNTTLYSAINIFATNITAQSMILSNGQNYGTYQPSNVNILESGWPIAQFGAGSGINGHVIIGSTNNNTGSDTANKDSGVGIFGGNWNFITDWPSTHMIDEYIFGGYSNTVETFYQGTPQFGTYTNNDILASIFCTINLNSGGTPTAWVVNNNAIIASVNSSITGPVVNNVQDNLILNGSNSVINAIGSAIDDVTVIGENANITNSHVVAISAGAAPFYSTTNNQILLEAQNGVVLNNSPLIITNGTIIVNGSTVATNLTPWQTDINANQFNLTNPADIGNLANYYLGFANNADIGLVRNGTLFGDIRNNATAGFTGLVLEGDIGQGVILTPSFVADPSAANPIQSDGSGNLTVNTLNLASGKAGSSSPVVDTVISQNGTAALTIQTNWILNGHFILGLPNNTMPEDSDAIVTNDYDVSLIAGNNNAIQDNPGSDMINMGIWGGATNSIFVSATNDVANDILMSRNSAIQNFSPLGANFRHNLIIGGASDLIGQQTNLNATAELNRDAIIDSFNSLIVFTNGTGSSGTNLILGSEFSTISNACRSIVIGSYAIVTNNDVVEINAGQTGPVGSSMAGTIQLNALNGVYANGVQIGSGGSGNNIYFIGNQSVTLPIATRPAICYTGLGGEFVKTNAATDNNGWLQIISDQ